MVNIKNPRERILKLRKEIRRHEYFYYVLDKPEISDIEFDNLMKELQELEQKYPKLITQDSPTQRVGGIPSEAFKPVKHSSPMLSIENCYTEGEFLEWVERTSESLKKNIDFVVEAKIDGLSCAIEYVNGIFSRASTRGDGETGEDVTLNVRTIRSVPLILNAENPPKFIEVRGEIYLEKKDFKKLYEEQISQGLEGFANPRNAAAGSLRQKDPKITSRRNLRFFAHSYGAINTFDEPKTHWEYLELCKNLGFAVSSVRKLCKTPEEVISFYKQYFSKRSELPYEIDGLVVKVNGISQQKFIGSTSKSPRWAIAFKYPAQQVTTSIKNVWFSVGRTGVITPVAELEPVQCGGVIISSSTLHNFDEIKRLGLRNLDKVVVERAGEVIPKIVKVIISDRTGKEKEIKPPSHCPSCNGNIFKEENEVAFRCINPSCPNQIKRSLLHFASRDAMNIEGLGEAVAEQLLEKKLIKDFSTLYRLKKEDLLKLTLFKDKKAENLLAEIEKSKSQPLSKLIFGIGIRHVGEKNARVLAAHFKNIDNLINANFEEISGIYEIGPIIAKAIVDFFKQTQVRELICKLKSLGINTTEPETGKINLKFNKMTFVFTGELKSMTRKLAQEKVRLLGGQDSSSISGKTNYVVLGENPGSKLQEAKKLGVKIITEEEFLKMLGSLGSGLHI